MRMTVTATGMTIDVPNENTARLYQSRGFAVPAVDPDCTKEAPKAGQKAKRPTKR